MTQVSQCLRLVDRPGEDLRLKARDFYKTLSTCADLGEGPRPPFSGEFYKRFMRKNTEMKVQVPFSGPLVPELGSRPPFF